MKRALTLLFLAACSRGLDLPAAGQPAVFSNFRGSEFVRPGGPATLTFETSKSLAATPDVRLGGTQLASCALQQLTWTCSGTVPVSAAEGALAISVSGVDQAGNVTKVPVALQVTVDGTAPVLAVSAAPDPAVRGASVSFVIDANEALGAAPSVTGELLSTIPICTGSGLRFVCAGGIVSSQAPIGAATFKATGVDRAGNTADATVSLQVQNPVLPPPTVTVGNISPNPATVGTVVSFDVTGSRALTSCAASVAGQLAACAAPSDTTCTCSFTVPSSLLEGNNIVLGFGTNENGTGTGSAGVQIDKTPPVITAAQLTVARHEVGADDGVSAAAGAIADSGGVQYDGQGLTLVKLWDAATGGHLLATATPNADGSFDEVAMPDTDGSADDKLSPPVVYVSAVDVPGNESARVAIPAGADTTPAGVGTLLSHVRRPIGAPDGVKGDAGAFTNAQCAMRLAKIWDSNLRSGVLIASGPIAADGSVAEIAEGTATVANADLYVSGVDKCGTEGARVLVANGREQPPVANAALMTVNRRALTARDGVQGAASATAAVVCFPSGVNVYSQGASPDDLTLIGSGPTLADGSFAEVLFGANDTSFPRIVVKAVDKCGSESAPALVSSGADPGPAIDGAKVTLLSRAGGAASGVTGLAGAVTSPVSVIKDVWISDVAGARLATVSTAGDGSFSETAIGAGSRTRVVVNVQDKAGVTFAAPARNVQLALDLAGKTPLQSLPAPMAVYPFAADRDPRLDSPGLAAASGPEAQDYSGALVSAASPATDPAVALGWTRAPFPPARSMAATAYDPARGVWVLFGGWNGDDLGDTWELDGAGWHFRGISGPAGTHGAAMGYDGTGVVLFGGRRGGNDGQVNNELWRWDGSAWTKLNPVHTPSPRFESAMTALGPGLALFGGLDHNGDTLGDTWVWDGNDWTPLLLSTTPSPRYGARMDAGPDGVYLFGGEDAGGDTPGDLWKLSGGAWSLVATGGPTVEAPGFAYDAGRQVFVVFGGFPSQLGTNYTFQFDGTQWTQSPVATDPGIHDEVSMTYDPGRGALVVFGGVNSGAYIHYFGDTLIYDGTDWVPLFAAPGNRMDATFAWDSARQRGVLFGGRHDPQDAFYSNELWETDGASWKLTPSDVTPERAFAAAAFDSARGRTVLFGGLDSFGTVLQAHSEWNGTAWTYPEPATLPPGRFSSAAAYDAGRGVVVLFGGEGENGTLDDTWEYDGVDWRRVAATTAGPSARAGHAMAYDANRGLVLLYGGHLDTQVFDDVWEYDGVQWHQDASTGHAYQRAAAAWDPLRQRLVVVGGQLNATYGTSFDMDPVNGPDAPPAVTPPNRASAWAGFLPPLGRVLAGGGVGTGDKALFGDEWLYGATTAHARYAAQVISVPFDRLATLGTYSVSWTGSGSGGVELLGWDWSARAWVSLGTSASAATFNVSPAAPLSRWIRDGHAWLMAVAASTSPASVETDGLSVQATYTLP